MDVMEGDVLNRFGPPWFLHVVQTDR